jgi:hypothetical protein
MVQPNVLLVPSGTELKALQMLNEPAGEWRATKYFPIGFVQLERISERPHPASPSTLNGACCPTGFS